MIKRIQTKVTRGIHSVLYCFVWSFFFLIFRAIPYFLIKIKTEGKENIPKKGRFIIAANHQNFFDGYLVVCPTGPFKKVSALIAKRALKSKGNEYLARMIGSVVLEDGIEAYHKALKKLNNILSRGGVVSIFPEGSVSGRNIPRKFKGGVAKLSIDSRTKVLPVYLSGTYELRYIKNWLKRSEITMKIGKPIELYRYAKDCNNDLEKMAGILREKIIELSGLNENECSEEEIKPMSVKMPIGIYEPKIKETVV